MTNIFITADKIGGWEGGASVTGHESHALSALGDCITYCKDNFDNCKGEEPWRCDDCLGEEVYKHRLADSPTSEIFKPKLAHFYAGTFGRTANQLKQWGVPITWTIAAHDREESKKQFENFGIDFCRLFPHLCEPELWERYISGYALADVIICPSTVAANTVRGYGGVFETKRIEIVPHGCNPVETVAPLPKRFTLGYMGSCTAPDKGVIYLLKAWKKLNYKDATLVIAGHDSTSAPFVDMVSKYGGGNIQLMGWVKNIADFYNKITWYCQPSATEGFGMEVLESFMHGRPALCSMNAGAQDIVPEEFKFEACDADRLAESIDWAKKNGEFWDRNLSVQDHAHSYTWDKIEQQYIDLWKGLLA